MSSSDKSWIVQRLDTRRSESWRRSGTYPSRYTYEQGLERLEKARRQHPTLWYRLFNEATGVVGVEYPPVITEGGGITPTGRRFNVGDTVQIVSLNRSPSGDPERNDYFESRVRLGMAAQIREVKPGHENPYVLYFPSHGFTQVAREHQLAPLGAGTYYEGGSSMTEPSKPLNVKRETILERLREKLQEGREAHEKVLAEQREARKQSVERIEALCKEPVLLLFIVENYFGKGWVSRFDSAEDMLNNLREQFPSAQEPSYSNPAIEKLIRVLEAAVDDTIEVSPTDNLYQYL